MFNEVLGSPREMVDAGNRIALDKDNQGKSCSCLERKATGMRTVIHERNGTFQFDIQVPRGKGGGVEEVEDVRGKTEDVKRGEGFPRQGTLLTNLFY